MKKIFFYFLMLKALFFGCAKEEVNTLVPLPTPNDYFQQLKLEYNIEKSGLILESIADGLDTTLLFINGRVKNQLWLGCYDKTTKINKFEWIEQNKLDTILNLNTGYGNYSDIEINKFAIRSPYFNDNHLLFILHGINNLRIVSSDLYFLDNQKLIRKQRSFTYPREHFFQDLKPWYNGVFSKYSENVNILFSTTGDSLYSFDNSLSTIERSEYINEEECIEFNAESITSDARNYNFKRRNLKNNTYLWVNNTQPLKSISSTARFDSTNIQKENNIWRYDFYYTSLNGDTGLRILSLNIDTGELIVKNE